MNKFILLSFIVFLNGCGYYNDTTIIPTSTKQKQVVENFYVTPCGIYNKDSESMELALREHITDSCKVVSYDKTDVVGVAVGGTGVATIFTYINATIDVGDSFVTGYINTIMFYKPNIKQKYKSTLYKMKR
jgi:hypothetical protein